MQKYINKLLKKCHIRLIILCVIFIKCFECLAQNSEVLSDDKLLISLVIDTLLKKHKKYFINPIMIQENTEKIFACDTVSLKIALNIFAYKQKIKVNMDTISLNCKNQIIFSIVIDNPLIKLISKKSMSDSKVGHIISTPLFLLSRKYAVVEVNFICKPLCDRNEAYFFEKKGDMWVLLYKKVIFSS